jgi:glutathione S-transferase
MRLYHHPFSTNSRRAVMAAYCLEAPLELVLVDLAKGANREPGFLKINPNHKVPVLDDGGFILWESCAIAQYLADRTPGQTLYPTEPKARADVNRWLFWSGAHFGPGIGILNFEHWVKALVGQGAADPNEVRRGEQQVREFGGILDAHLANREWISGDKLTLADLALAAPLSHAVRSKLPIDDLAHLQRWFSHVKTLDAWKRTEPPAP